jgi:hypothetical protein
MLEAMRRRAQRVSPADLLNSYESDRFVGPSAAPTYRLRRQGDALIRCLPANYELLTLAPLLPLGSHFALGAVDQNKVVSTVRNHDVAADPTNGLALEAALRRRNIRSRHPRSSAKVRLAALQRVTRSQRFHGPASFPHFEIFGLVTAGRDTGNLDFECESAGEQIAFVAAALMATGADEVRVELTDLTGQRMQPTTDRVRTALSRLPGIKVVDYPERAEGRTYYDRFCFRALASFDGKTIEVADGGLVDWTAKLLQDRKERLFISGIGIDRIALWGVKEEGRR